MIDNAIDFIENGLESVLVDDEREYKYAILHLHADITLFLKDVLSKEHWSFIVQNIDKASKEDLISGDVQTVNYNTLINRLNKLTSFKISDDFSDSLNYINQTRNNIEHYQFQVNAYQLKSKLAQLLHNLMIFLSQIHTIDDNYEEVLKLVRRYSLEYDTYHNERYRVIQSRLDQVNDLFICPKCDQTTVELSQVEDKAYCHFCDQEINDEELKEIIEFLTFPFENEHNVNANNRCPNCELETLYNKSTFSYDISSDWICFHCFNTYEEHEIDYCDGCGAAIHYQDDYSLCSGCVDYRLNQ